MNTDRQHIAWHDDYVYRVFDGAWFNTQCAILPYKDNNLWTPTE